MVRIDTIEYYTLGNLSYALCMYLTYLLYFFNLSIETLSSLSRYYSLLFFIRDNFNF